MKLISKKKALKWFPSCGIAVPVEITITAENVTNKWSEKRNIYKKVKHESIDMNTNKELNRRNNCQR